MTFKILGTTVTLEDSPTGHYVMNLVKIGGKHKNPKMTSAGEEPDCARGGENGCVTGGQQQRAAATDSWKI